MSTSNTSHTPSNTPVGDGDMGTDLAPQQSPNLPPGQPSTENPPSAQGVSSNDSFFSSDASQSTPSYAAAVLTYGLQVDPHCLAYTARAFQREQHAWRFLADLSDRKFRPAAGASARCSACNLPKEVVARIRSHALRDAVRQAECATWLLFGEDSPEYAAYHPRYCCDRPPPYDEWPGLVQETISAARDAFRDHFSFVIPRCDLPCSIHPVCHIIHTLLREYFLCLADCPFDSEDRPVNWIISPLDPVRQSSTEHADSPVKDTARLLDGILSDGPLEGAVADNVQSLQSGPAASIHNLALDTGRIANQQVRRSKNIAANWQSSQVKFGKDNLVRFVVEMLMRQPAHASKTPEFFLICIGQKAV